MNEERRDVGSVRTFDSKLTLGGKSVGCLLVSEESQAGAVMFASVVGALEERAVGLGSSGLMRKKRLLSVRDRKEGDVEPTQKN